MARVERTISEGVWPKITVELQPHYAEGWLIDLNAEKQLYLQDIQVTAEERRMGIGRLLMKHLLTTGKELGATRFVSSPCTPQGVAFIDGIFNLTDNFGGKYIFNMPLDTAITIIESEVPKPEVFLNQ